MIDPAEARRLATEGLAALPSETVALDAALDRAAAEPLVCTRPLPGVTNSAMDGYALRHADAHRPLTVAMAVPAGQMPERVLEPGEAARIFTGAPVPDGADTVVMQEDTRREGDVVHVVAAPARGANIRWRGEDVDAGEPLIAVGDVLTPGRLAMIAAQGHRRVAVVRRCRVAVVPNGDELVPIDAEVAPGQVPNTNAHMLAAQVRAAGGVPVVFDPVPDRPDAVVEAFRRATAEADLVLTTGGMSVGDFDFAREALATEGAMAFYKVRLKPGKPLGLGRIGGVPVLGLPGNPVSAFVGFELFGRPMLRTLGGWRDTDHPRFHAPLAHPVRRNRSRPEFIRCDVVDGQLVPWPKQGSGMISSLLHADALALVPMGEGALAAGAVIEAVDLRR